MASGLLTVPALAAGTVNTPAYDIAGRQTLYVESNATGSGKNAVFAFGLSYDGSLQPLPGSPFLTGGTGYFDPSFKLGPFDNDQQLTLSGDGRTLYAVNGGSNTISALHIGFGGQLANLLGWPIASGGSTPVSIGQQANSLVVLNSTEDPAQATSTPVPNTQSFDLLPGGFPLRRPRQELSLPRASNPTQVLTTDTGRFIFGTNFPAGGDVSAFARQADGTITQADTALPPTFDGVQALALGLWAHPSRPFLYAGLVNVNRVAIYRWNTEGHLQYIGAVADSGQGPCWLRTTRDGHFLLAANTADQSISVFDLSNPSSPTEVTRAVGGGLGGYFEFSLSPDQRHVYVLEQENSVASAGKSNKIHVFDFDPSSGQITSDPGKLVTLPVDASTRPIGMAVR